MAHSYDFQGHQVRTRRVASRKAREAQQASFLMKMQRTNEKV